ncbi:hypothetical protein A2U01_0077036, partial [Trifolium medium]|nr:hypothetical protein [Trifolium medium]
EQESWEEWLSL